MEVTLYMPYYGATDDANDMGDYYQGDEYIKQMKEMYESTKDTVFETMLDANRGSTNALIGTDGQMYKFMEKTPQNEGKVVYLPSSCALYNGDGKEETVDGIITYFARQEAFVEMFVFDVKSMDEDLESELSVWNQEHRGVNSYVAKKGDEWAWANEPVRDLKMEFKNNAGETLYALLHECKIMDKVDNDSYILFVKRITLIDRI